MVFRDEHLTLLLLLLSVSSGVPGSLLAAGVPASLVLGAGQVARSALVDGGTVERRVLDDCLSGVADGSVVAVFDGGLILAGEVWSAVDDRLRLYERAHCVVYRAGNCR